MLRLCWLPLGLIIVCCSLPVAVLSSSSDIQLLKRHAERHTNGGVHVPILRRQAPKLQRRSGQTGGIGLGDFQDVTYNVLITIGGIETSLVLDTGSSDLWVISDACTGNCSTSIPLYSPATFQPTGLSTQLNYGDSSTGTHAYGPIGKDTVGLAGLTLQNQYFAAINSTNTTVLETGSAGIFGLGFPVNSVIWMQVFQQTVYSTNARRNVHTHTLFPRQSFPRFIKIFAIRWFPKNNLHRSTFPSTSTRAHLPRQSASVMPEILSSFASIGPFLSRLVAQGSLASPMITITIQRDSVEVGGNIGMLAIGELPTGVNNESLTWAQVRGYPTSAGGLAAPAYAPNEVYPVTWEIPLDDVYFDGQRLPRSKLSSPNISLTALIDTGNSLIRGPSDVIQLIVNRLGSNGNFPCTDAHSLAFQIGGQMFPVDPRDFIAQVFTDSVNECMPNLAPTDPPKLGGSGYLYSWSLGDPFLKSVLASFYYGNLTYPSQDPPRIGLLSTVPTGTVNDLSSAVAEASANGGNFPTKVDLAPSGTFKAAGTDSASVAQAPTTTSKSSGSHRTRSLHSWITIFLCIGVVLSRQLS